MSYAGRVYVVLLVGIFMVSGALAMVVASFQHQLDALAADTGELLIRHVRAVEDERGALDESLWRWHEAPETDGFAAVRQRLDGLDAAFGRAAAAFADRAAGLPAGQALVTGGAAAVAAIRADLATVEAREATAYARARDRLAGLRRAIQEAIGQISRVMAIERMRNHELLRSGMWRAVALFSGIFLIWAAISTMLHLEKRKVMQLRDELEARVAWRTHELAQKNQALEQANENLRHFAAIASHDLQEPLRKIKTFASMLADEIGAASADAGRALDIIIGSADRLRALVSDLLAYSRLTSQALKIERVDLNAALGTVLQDLSLQIAEAGADIAADELPHIEADATHMRQLLQNLIANALKYRAPGRPCRVTVTMAPDAASGGAMMSVSDNGIGFAPEQARRIFEPFQRLHRTSEYAGTGIGLAICARIAEHHGWRIEADGAPGEGATFRIIMPRTSVPAARGRLSAAA